MWQVEFPKGWCDIDVSVQESIQLAYDSGSPTVVFSVLQSSRLGLWRHYEIDFSCMEQRNVNSGRIRKIRLSPEDANATLALEDSKRMQCSCCECVTEGEWIHWKRYDCQYVHGTFHVYPYSHTSPNGTRSQLWYFFYCRQCRLQWGGSLKGTYINADGHVSTDSEQTDEGGDWFEEVED